MEEQKNSQKSSVGDLDENVAALLACLFCPVSSIVFYVMEKNSRLVKFYAMQAMLAAAAIIASMIVITIIGFIPILGVIVGFLGSLVIGIGSFALWIILMIKAYKNEWFKLPIIGDIAEKQANI